MWCLWGVELGQFSPVKRDPQLRRSLGLAEGQPLLIYVGRLDREKRPDVVVEAFRRLPPPLGATLLLLGDGPMREQFVGRTAERIFAPGFCRDRDDLAAWLASADLYVSAMADETFGVSILEAQASGLPVVGVAAGAMIDRVTDEIGRLGPVDDADAMAANILSVLKADRSRMGEIAQLHAREYSWDRSMEALFGHIYRSVFRSSVERTVQSAAPPSPILSAPDGPID